MSGRPINWPIAIVMACVRAAGAILCVIGLHRWEKRGRTGWRCSGCLKWHDQ